MAHDVFVAYAHEDRHIAELVVAALEKNGLECWMAPRNVKAGESYASAIVRAIKTTRAMVIVLSDATNKSEHVVNEVERAFHAGKVIVPFRMANVQPSEDLEYFLSRTQWLDAFDGQPADHVSKLATALIEALKIGDSTVQIQIRALPSDDVPPATEKRREDEMPMPAESQTVSAPPPSYVLQAPQYQQPLPGSQRSPNVPVIVAISAIACVVLFCGIGFAIMRGSAPQDTNVSSTTSATTTGIAIDSSSGSTGSAASTGPTGTTTGDPVGNTVTSDAEWSDYNTKMSSAFKQLQEATIDFAQLSTTLVNEPDPTASMDKAAPMYDSFAHSLDRIASSYDLITPPPEAVTIHHKVADEIHQIASLVENVAQAARSHDFTDFQSAMNKVKDYGQSADQDVNTAVVAGGFDPVQYSKDGTLVKKS